MTTRQPAEMLLRMISCLGCRTSQEKVVAVMVHGWYPCSSTTFVQ